MLPEAKYKAKYEEVLKILTSEQMLERLPIAVAQVNARNNSDNLLNEIRKIIYLLYQSKEIIKGEFINY